MRLLLGDHFWAGFNSKRFTPFLKGVEVKLPTGETLNLKITRLQSAREKQLFQFHRYSYFAEVSAGSISEIGHGDSDLELLAIQKSIAEAIERCLFRALKGTGMGTRTSNGWAAHVSRKLAAQSALDELLERDAVMVHALKETPFLIVDDDSFPMGLKEWAQRELDGTELSRLRLLISTDGHVPSLSVMFVSKSGHGVVAHAIGESPLSALKRALSEACRLGRIALSGHYYKSSAFFSSQSSSEILFGAGDHAVAYAYYRPFPLWMFGPKIQWSKLPAIWRKHLRRFKEKPIRSKFNEIIQGPISAGFCTSVDIQPLFFGKAPDANRRGDINWERLNMKHGERLNDLPHFVA